MYHVKRKHIQVNKPYFKNKTIKDLKYFLKIKLSNIFFYNSFKNKIKN